MTEAYLAHHGIKGQKWGVRRFENEDGTLTPAGKQRYAVDSNDRNLKDRVNKASTDYQNNRNADTYRALRESSKDYSRNVSNALILDEKARARDIERVSRGERKSISTIKGYAGTQIRDAGHMLKGAGIGATLGAAAGYIASGGNVYAAKRGAMYGAAVGAYGAAGKRTVERLVATYNAARGGRK